MNYFETLGKLCEEFGVFLKRSFCLNVEHSRSRLNSFLDKKDILSEMKDIGDLVRGGKDVFVITFHSRREIGDETDPLDFSDFTAVGDSLECASKNAIELLMNKIKHRFRGLEQYEHFCNLDILRDKCFFTPYGLYWGDWKTNTDFVCSAVKDLRGDRLSPVDRDEWATFRNRQRAH